VRSHREWSPVDAWPGLPRLVVHLDVGVVLGPDPAGETVVAVGLDPRAAPHLQIAVGVGQIKHEQAALRARDEVLGLPARRIERDLQLAGIVKKPDLGDLGKPSLEALTAARVSLREPARRRTGVGRSPAQPRPRSGGWKPP